MAFNFGTFSNVTAVNTNKPSLKPYDIYKVKLGEVKIESGTSKNDSSKVWKAIKLPFETEKGIYNHNIFFIDIAEGSKDTIRPSFTNDAGHEYYRPSNVERTMYLLLQALTVVNPANCEKFKAVLPKCDTFDKVADYFCKLINVKNSPEFYIKLTGRNNNGTIYATLPDCVGLNKQNEIFVTNSISKEDNFVWSNYEKQQRDAYLNAKPTNMSTVVKKNSTDPVVEPVTEDSTEDDIDALLNELD